MEEIFTRRSVREYDLTKKLSRDELKDIIRAGMASPSARNQQSWRFVIIDDENIINELSNSITKSTMKLSNANTYIAVLGCADAPVSNLLPCDLGASQMNMMTYARSKNLGTCWIGVYQNKEREEALKKILNIPAEFYPYSLMAIGYPLDLNCFKEVNRFDEEKIFYNRF
ncbi:MAG: nitroreductase family protein [Anaeroplasmataceae bacterium]